MLKRLHSLARRILYPAPSLEAMQMRAQADGLACALSILSMPAVQALYKKMGADPEAIRHRLDNLTWGEEGTDAHPGIDAGRLWHRQMAGLADAIPLEVCQLVGLFIHGHADLRRALTPPGGALGDIPFLVAHKAPEAGLRSNWPPVDEQTGHVLLLNDPFSPMEDVVTALEGLFGMDREHAVEKMIEVHNTGSAALDAPPDTGDAADTCARFNAAWRSKGLPLYFAPQRRTASFSDEAR